MILLFFMHIFQGLSAINCMYRILRAYTKDIHLKPSAANSDVMHALCTQCCSAGSWWRTHRPIPHAWKQKAPSDWEGGPHPCLRPRFIFWSQAGHILWDLNWPDRTSGHFSGDKSSGGLPGAGKSSQHCYWQLWTRCGLASLGNAKFPNENAW